jgi:hypothetical protein
VNQQNRVSVFDRLGQKPTRRANGEPIRNRNGTQRQRYSKYLNRQQQQQQLQQQQQQQKQQQQRKKQQRHQQGSKLQLRLEAIKDTEPNKE